MFPLQRDYLILPCLIFVIKFPCGQLSYLHNWNCIEENENSLELYEFRVSFSGTFDVCSTLLFLAVLMCLYTCLELRVPKFHGIILSYCTGNLDS